MKKLLISLVLVLAVSFTASAQGRTVKRTYKSKYTYTTSSPRQRHRADIPYNDVGEFRLHVVGELGSSDLTGLFWHEYPVHYSIGAMAEVQTGRILSLGLGAEFYGSRNALNHYSNSTYLNTVPVYASVRLSTPGSVKFFVEARAGYAIPVNEVSVNYPHNISAQGLYTSAGLGLSCYGNYLSVGFNTIDLSHAQNRTFTDFYLRYSYAFPLN
ncbi:MAG: hypothetical protein J6P73_05180 [Bacteroidales bacterium]|nr:hypothetical protein [Bacteroidales bacterium]